MDIYFLANYISQRYQTTYHHMMDEMKLHKLLYFIQRESYVLFGKPLFPNQFEAWKYGPVMRCLRTQEWKSEKPVTWPPSSKDEIKAVDAAFQRYAPMDSWSLSNISHGESCWRKAKDKEISWPVEILNEDIFIDAQKIIIRRAIFRN